jgi:hypothetical protein
MNKNVGYNLERLLHILLASAMIITGILSQLNNANFGYLTYVGIFIWGLIIGGLDNERKN